MAFGRRSNEVLGGDKGGEAGLPPHITRLIAAMDRIFSDAAGIANLLRAGKPMPVPLSGMTLDAPIHCANSETLFEHIDDNGQVLYTTYHFTQNLKQIDPEAQYKLSVLNQKAGMANALVNQSEGVQGHVNVAALKSLLDDVLVKSAYFGNFFKSYNIVRGILGRELDERAQAKAIEQHVADWAGAMSRAKALMFDPSRIDVLAPYPQASLVVASSGPYQEGQRVINGVVFAPELAKILMAKIVAEQTKAMAYRA